MVNIEKSHILHCMYRQGSEGMAASNTALNPPTTNCCKINTLFSNNPTQDKDNLALVMSTNKIQSKTQCGLGVVCLYLQPVGTLQRQSPHKYDTHKQRRLYRDMLNGEAFRSYSAKT